LPNFWASGHAESARITGDTLVVGINNRGQLAVWLRMQPHEGSRLLACRWTLRALPTASLYRSDLLSEIILLSFRVLAASLATTKYPSPELERTCAIAAAAAVRTFGAAARAARATEAVLADDAADDTVFRVGLTFAARAFAGAASDDADARAFGADAAARAFATVAPAAATAFWSAVSTDATQWEEGVAPSVIAGSPLWPIDLPADVRTLWQKLKAVLHAEKQDWQVWTAWYDDRLEGRNREKEHELAYVRIEETLWDQGPSIVNAEIKRLVETHTVPAESSPVLREALDKAATVVIANNGETAQMGISRFRRPVFNGFFSYSHFDAEVDPSVVETFYSELEKRVDANLVNARFEIWRDKEKLHVGDRWDKSIEVAINSCDVFIVLLTPKWISSDYCRKEYEAYENIQSARSSSGNVIPIYGRDIEGQAKYLETGQKELLDRLKLIQYQRAIPRKFARLSADERIDLVEDIADSICAMIDRLRA
jgi:TIR domain